MMVTSCTFECPESGGDDPLRHTAQHVQGRHDADEFGLLFEDHDDWSADKTKALSADRRWRTPQARRRV